MRKRRNAAAKRHQTSSPLALALFSALGATGAAGIVWLGIRMYPSLIREIKIWKM